MVNQEVFKQKIRELISQDYEIEFLGKNFDKIVDKISEERADKIYNWVKKTINKEIYPITVGSKKKYKDWQIYNLLHFVEKMKIDNTEYRIVLIKVKNSFYLEFHLSDHKYYDKLRKDLYLTKKSY